MKFWCQRIELHSNTSAVILTRGFDLVSWLVAGIVLLTAELAIVFVTVLFILPWWIGHACSPVLQNEKKSSPLKHRDWRWNPALGMQQLVYKTKSNGFCNRSDWPWTQMGSQQCDTRPVFQVKRRLFRAPSGDQYEEQSVVLALNFFVAQNVQLQSNKTRLFACDPPSHPTVFE